MRKIALVMKLKPGFEAEYKRRHDALWPEMADMLHEYGGHNYSIFIDEETNILFGVQKVAGEQSSQDMGVNPVVARWWAFMKDIMETNPDNSPVTIPLEEVFYLE